LSDAEILFVDKHLGVSGDSGPASRLSRCKASRHFGVAGIALTAGFGGAPDGHAGLPMAAGKP